MAGTLSRIRDKWRRRKEWWICEYVIEGTLAELDGVESGSFPCVGRSRVIAERSAEEHIRRTAYTTGKCSLTIRRPRWYEVIFRR